jgi:hypothetical protein
MDKQKVLELKNNMSISELIKVVLNGGINTDIECINKYADIIGCKSMDELETGAREDKATFFFLLRHVWNMVDILEFYNNYCNDSMLHLIEENQRLQELECQNKKYLENIENLKIIIKNMDEKARQHIEHNIKSSNRITELENELLRLKAKLYDFQNGNR